MSPLRCVTYNVSHGVMSDAEGWEVEVVRPCRTRYGRGVGTDGLTGCARAGVEHLATVKPDLICLQEMTMEHIGAWMDHLRYVTGRSYACILCDDEQLTTAVVWDPSLLGTGRRIGPASKRVVAVYFETVQLIVCSVHIKHADAQKNGGTVRFLTQQIQGENRPTAQLLVMGDFNDTYGQGTTSITLCGVEATLRSPNLRTCCADEQDKDGAYPYVGDYIYASGGLPTIECHMLEDVVPRTSDHKAVVFMTMIRQPEEKKQLVVGTTHFQHWDTRPPCTEPVYYGLVQPIDSRLVTGRSFSHVMPVLVVHAQDFNMLLERTHRGAFGSDHRTLTIGDVCYVVVWKWPADMFGTSTGLDKKRIEFLPLPVGQYHLSPDPWFTPRVKGAGKPVTKWRVNTGARESIHYLQKEDGARIPMVTSLLFMSQMWSNTEKEIKTVSNFTQRLAEHGILAFPCHGQHHAIVFYSFHEEPLSPAIFCALVETHRPILQILSENGLLEWFTMYRSYFLNAKK